MEELFSEIVHSQVLVAGGGGAGIRAAATAAQLGKEVLLVSETPIGNSGSTFYPLSYEWGMLFAADEKDAETFFQEITSASGECMNKKLAQKLAFDSREAYWKMREEGISFVPMKDVGIVGCFGAEPRGAFAENLEQVMESQRKLLEKQSNLHFRDDLTIVSLLVVDEICYGAVGIDTGGHAVCLLADAVILACGGGEDLYEYGTAHGHLLGSAYAMAARQGARLVNLEFIQFVHGTVEPVRGINYYPFSYQELPAIRNSKGEDCLENYLPQGVTQEECLLAHAKHGPFSTDSVGKYMEFAMAGEASKGDTGLWVIPDRQSMRKDRYRLWESFLNRHGLDSAVPMKLYTFAQGFNGGILMHQDMTTDIRGLFACGESAGGCHGPNRMGGLCILATQVFGRAAGEAAVHYCDQVNGDRPEKNWDEIFRKEFEYERKPESCENQQEWQDKKRDSFYQWEGAGEPAQILSQVRGIMQEYAGINRWEEGLARAREAMERLQINPLAYIGKPLCRQFFQARNAVDSARLILYSMQLRKESRGCHHRVDFPERDEEQTNMNWVTMNGREILGGQLRDE